MREARRILKDSDTIPVPLLGVREIISTRRADLWGDPLEAQSRELDEPLIWWLWKARFYITAEELSPADVEALVLEDENRRRLRLEKAHALMAMRMHLDKRATRQPIPHEVKVAVWQRDNGRCVDCESKEELEFDHIIPLAMGGANTERNLQLLCAICNRRKGATLG
jgi:hypothetical protein